ncbi:MAG: AcvB/VirJ family lysyl-phosphatidylglycerol hydrolase [Thermoanaerobaculia bacterium]
MKRRSNEGIQDSEERRKGRFGSLATISIAAALLISVAASSFARTSSRESTVEFGRFGTVHLYAPPHPASRLVVFVSGDGGWNKGVVDMARELSTMGVIVAGVDIRSYLRNLESVPGTCSYPAADYEGLSQFLQKRLGFDRYEPPVLAGYSSGATLVYALLAEAPPNTFKGAMSLGFCPDLPLKKPFCRGNGLEWRPGPKGKGVIFEPAKDLRQPWIAFDGEIDQVCDAKAARAYVANVPGGEMVLLPKVGHGFSVPRNWLGPFKAAYGRIAAAPMERDFSRPSASTVKRETGAAAVVAAPADLPLIDVPPSRPGAAWVAVILSGDGGWAGIDRSIGNFLAANGVPVVGLNSLQYFWHRKTPETAAHDLQRLIEYAMVRWNVPEVVLIGYSRGADVLPAMASRLPEQLRSRVRMVALLGPSRTTTFEFHLSDWLSDSERGSAVAPEVEKLRGTKILCVYGADEKESLCRDLAPEIATPMEMGGGHHFDGGYEEIARAIMRDSER